MQDLRKKGTGQGSKRKLVRGGGGGTGGLQGTNSLSWKKGNSDLGDTVQGLNYQRTCRLCRDWAGSIEEIRFWKASWCA